MAQKTRNEHIQWCKDRALKACDENDLTGAFASMVSDLKMHEETDEHIGIGLGTAMLFGGHLNSQFEMRKFINGFN